MDEVVATVLGGVRERRERKGERKKGIEKYGGGGGGHRCRCCCRET